MPSSQVNKTYFTCLDQGHKTNKHKHRRKTEENSDNDILLFGLAYGS